MSRGGLRHDAESAVYELVYPPELLRRACEGRNRGEFVVLSGSEGPVCAFYGDLVIWLSEISAIFGNCRDCPSLVRTEHVVAAAYFDVAFRPAADHVFKLLVLKHDVVSALSSESEHAACGPDEVHGEFKGITPSL